MISLGWLACCSASPLIACTVCFITFRSHICDHQWFCIFHSLVLLLPQAPATESSCLRDSFNLGVLLFAMFTNRALRMLVMIRMLLALMYLCV